MKIKIDEVELYPFYTIEKKSGNEYNISKDLFDKWERVMDDFWEVQNEMEEIYNGWTSNENDP